MTPLVEDPPLPLIKLIDDREVELFLMYCPKRRRHYN